MSDVSQPSWAGMTDDERDDELIGAPVYAPHRYR